MRNRNFITAAAAALLLCGGARAAAESLVILHTNDTHSNIEPDSHGQGGVLQRKAIIDSVRKAEKNVILVDAGDMVQGTLFFKYFKGDVEYPLMNMMGYDIRILGNHEFDNGMKELARHYRQVKGARLSANYDFTGTELEGVFDPYVIKKVGGKKIGFIGLNVDPASLISPTCISVRFKDIIQTANATAEYLKDKKHCDLVVAVTHIGYTGVNGKTTDVDLARASRDIDIIIGGHSHTTVDPRHPEKTPYLVGNAEGRPVLIAQTGKYGRNIGYIRIDLDALKGATGKDFGYELIPVTDRFAPEQLDKAMDDFLAPYRHAVDSVNSRVIAYSALTMPNGEGTGPLANFTADFGLRYGRHKADSLRAAGVDIAPVDFALMNFGGIRQTMEEGPVTEGQILSTYPFSNHYVIVRIKGSDFIEAMKAAAKRGGEAVSGNVRVLTDSLWNVTKVIIDGEEMDPDREYVMGSIDYVVEGNDDMVTLANHEAVWRDDVEVAAPIMKYVVDYGRRGEPISPDPTPRFMREAAPAKN